MLGTFLCVKRETRVVLWPALLRELRVELGQNQDEIAERALATGKVFSKFSRQSVSKALKDGTGLSSADTRKGFAFGLGLTFDDLEEYLHERIGIEDAVRRSKITPNPKRTAELRAEEARARAKATPGPGTDVGIDRYASRALFVQEVMHAVREVQSLAYQAQKDPGESYWHEAFEAALTGRPLPPAPDEKVVQGPRPRPGVLDAKVRTRRDG